MGLSNKVKMVNELLADELALNGLDMIDNSNIMFSSLWDNGLHIYMMEALESFLVTLVVS